MLQIYLHISEIFSTFVPENKVYKNNGIAAYHSPKEGIAGAGNVLAPANKL